MHAPCCHYGRLLLLAALLTAAPGQSLVTSTYLGGSANDTVRAMARDSAGNLYILGETYSSDFPVTPGALQTTHGGVPGSYLMIGDNHAADLFIAKLSPDASKILWSTYLGGTGNETAGGISVDAAGSVYVAGSTTSPNLPVTSGAFQITADFTLHKNHGFVAKIAPDGSRLLWSTLIAGDDIDLVNAIASDAAGSVYIAGATTSSNFPTTPGAWQRSVPGSVPRLFFHGFVAKLSPDGARLIYSTLLGGSQGASPASIAVDNEGGAMVAGSNSSIDFPTTPGAYSNDPHSSGFAARVHPLGVALTWSTFVEYPALSVTGVSNGDTVIGGYGIVLRLAPNGALRFRSVQTSRVIASVAVDAQDNVWAAGHANGDYAAAPCTSVVESPFQNSQAATNCIDPFLARIDASGNAQLQPTVAGNDFDSIAAVILDSQGGYTIAGTTRSLNLPITAGVIQPAKNRTICTFWGSPTSQTATACSSGFIARYSTPVAQLRVLHGGSREPGPVAPREVVFLTHPSLVENGGSVAMIDEFAVPVLRSAAGEVLLQIPDEVAGRKQITVRIQGLTGTADLGALLPSVFLILNPDGSVNSPEHPAPAGSVAALYGTGVPSVGVEVWIGGQPTTLIYAGPAPGMVSGVQQVNFRVPSALSGGQPLFVAAGTPIVTSQAGIVLSIAR